jgi:hypothetical protein
MSIRDVFRAYLSRFCAGNGKQPVNEPVFNSLDALGARHGRVPLGRWITQLPAALAGRQDRRGYVIGDADEQALNSMGQAFLRRLARARPSPPLQQPHFQHAAQLL